MPGKKMILKSPAKINLGLKIVRKRPDGYHDIETIFQMITIFDILTFKERNSGIVLKTDHKELPTDDSNLVVKAVKLLREKTKIRKGVEILLNKNIPIGAGLGGGSSNAAFALKGLNDLWGLNLAKKDLMEMAITLGSDVPFFLSGPAALGEGRGEILTPLKSNANSFVIVVFPNIFISAGFAYGELKLGLTSNSKDINILRLLLIEGKIADLGRNLFNDLEIVVCKRHPVLVEIKNKLLNSGAVGSLVSGSGSSVFGLFPQPESAHKAVAKLKKEKWQVFLAEIINKSLN